MAVLYNAVMASISNSEYEYVGVSMSMKEWVWFRTSEY